MDTELARTFLTVVAAGNFVNAAEQLHLTQSTVSARIRVLEEQLGCRLFVRNKAGTSLTSSGRQFQRHAASLVRTVEQARHEVGVAKGFRTTLTVGGRFGLWEQLLLKWVPWMLAKAPDVAIRAEIGFEAELMQGLVGGRLDIGVMYTPESRPGLVVVPLLEEKLVMVTTASADSSIPAPGYVYVDWGPEFYAKHNASFPDYTGPALTVNIGWLGIQHILTNGGSGYFPLRLVGPLIENGILSAQPDAPKFVVPAYLVHHADLEPELLELAVVGIRRIAEE